MAETLQELLPEDLQSDSGLQKIKGDDLSGQVTNLYSSYKELESKLGKINTEHEESMKGMVKIPGEDADEASRREFFSQLGCPKTPQEYPDIKLDGVPDEGQPDNKFFENIRKKCHERGVSSEVYQDVMTSVMKEQLVQLDEFIKKDEAAEKEAVAQLTKDWGGEDNFNKKVELGKRLIKHYDGEDSKLQDFLIDTRLGSYAPLVKMLGDIASDMIAEESTFSGETPPSSDSSKVELSKITGQPMLRYDKSPELKD